MKKDIAKDFPILNQKMNGHPLIYFDSAATTQKPQQVLDAMMHFYSKSNANIHRGIYQLSEHATSLYEQARQIVASFINARNADEIVFTRNTTESINMVAASWAAQHITENDHIVISELEHHSNLVPWQQLALKNKAELKYIPVGVDGTLDASILPDLITKKTKLISISHVSNSLGVHNGIQDIIDLGQKHGAKILIDAAQSVAHQPIDVQKMNCDFLAFSGHKLLGPTGIGVLYIKKELHNQIAPYQFGGGMVYDVDFFQSTWRPLPQKLEAGTPAIAQAVGLASAIEYIQHNIDWAQLRAHESKLCSTLIDGLSNLGFVHILGPIQELKKVGHLVSFIVDGIHAHDVAAYLNSYGICVRAGNQCAQPLAKKLGLNSSVRVSFYAYNIQQEVDHLIKILSNIRNKLS
jgi:cysteine desulfurase/selenocysteine lyase